MRNFQKQYYFFLFNDMLLSAGKQEAQQQQSAKGIVSLFVPPFFNKTIELIMHISWPSHRQKRKRSGYGRRWQVFPVRRVYLVQGPDRRGRRSSTWWSGSLAYKTAARASCLPPAHTPPGTPLTLTRASLAGCVCVFAFFWLCVLSDGQTVLDTGMPIRGWEEFMADRNQEVVPQVKRPPPTQHTLLYGGDVFVSIWCENIFKKW